MVDRIWGEGENDKSAPFEATAQAVAFVKKIQELELNTDVKRALQSRVLNAVADLSQSRLALFLLGGRNAFQRPSLQSSFFGSQLFLQASACLYGPIGL